MKEKKNSKNDFVCVTTLISTEINSFIDELDKVMVEAEQAGKSEKEIRQAIREKSKELEGNRHSPALRIQ